MDNDDNTIVISSLGSEDIVINLDGKVNAAQTMYSGTSDNTFVISDGVNSVTTYNSDWIGNAGGISTITINSDYNISLGNDTIDLSGIYNIEKKMFENAMPEIDELERMCEEYPGLAKAYETFKTVYKMVEQDWKGKKEDDNPF